MAEAIGLLGISLATPELLAILYKASRVIYDRCHKVRHHDENLQKYRKLADHLSTGIIKTQVQLVLTTIHDEILPEDIRNGLDQSFKDLVQAIVDVDGEFQSLFKKPFSAKMKKILLGENIKLINKLNTLEEHQRLFERYSNYVNLYRSAPPPNKLDSRSFNILGEREDHRPGQNLRTSDIFVSRGNVCHGGNSEVFDVILEERQYNQRTQQTVEFDLRILVGKLQLAQQLSGIPECLGYRQNPYDSYFELVFQLPPNLTVRSLADMLKFDTAPPLEERLSVCKMLASSVSDIHGLDFVQKNIRPRSILIASNRLHTDLSGLLLTDWTVARDVKHSSRCIGESAWERSIYQHPSRQGDQANQPYNFTHDIYSLGVCMLEVLMWDPFIVSSGMTGSTGQNTVSEIFRTRALQIGQVQAIPMYHLQDPERMTRYPQLVEAVMLDLALTELPRLIGSRVTGAVVKALGRSEVKNINEASARRKLALDLGVEYMRDILLVLNSSLL